MHCGSGFWGGQRPSLADYVRGPRSPGRRRRVLMLPTLLVCKVCCCFRPLVSQFLCHLPRRKCQTN